MRRRKPSFDEHAQALLDEHVAREQARLRPTRVRIDPLRRELVAKLCLRSSLSPEQLVARALDEYAVRHGMAVESARVAIAIRRKNA